MILRGGGRFWAGTVDWLVEGRGEILLLGTASVVTGVIFLDWLETSGAGLESIIGFSSLGDTLVLVAKVVNIGLLLSDWSVS